MSDEDTLDGRQLERTAGQRQPSAPTGLEELVALAALGPEWRGKVLSDPLAAAGEAGLELSDTERAVVVSVSGAALEQMIDSFGKKLPRPKGIRRMAASAAAAALLATSLTGCDGCARQSVTDGIRPDIPVRRPPPETFAEGAEKEEKPEPKVEDPKDAPRPAPDSDDALRTDPKGTPMDDTARPGITGIPPDVPPERGTDAKGSE